MSKLIDLAKQLVKEHIPGSRKGLPDAPLYLHSYRVFESLQLNKADEEACLAGLLHDIVEDGGVTLEDLRQQGFTERTLECVRLATHDDKIVGSDARWTVMMAGLTLAENKDAWLIKIADVLDNLSDCYAMSMERQKFMIEVKAPLIISLSRLLCENHPLWNALDQRIEQQRRRLSGL